MQATMFHNRKPGSLKTRMQNIPSCGFLAICTHALNHFARVLVFLAPLSPMPIPPPPLKRDVRPVHIYIYTHGGGESECILATTSINTMLHALNARSIMPLRPGICSRNPSKIKWPMQPQLLARLMQPRSRYPFDQSRNMLYATSTFLHPSCSKL
jgi:hypothetical protein